VTLVKAFNRFELKYFVRVERYRDLVADLAHFMQPDEHGDVDGFYRIISLYYDSPDFACYRSKIEGLKFRRKLRLRIYQSPGQALSSVDTGFVEIKQRYNRTTQKKRIVLPLQQAKRLCAGEATPSGLDARDTATAAEIAYLIRAMQLKPAAIVSYRRRAFVGGRYERGMRLTFDQQLEGRTHALEVNQVAQNYHFLPLDWVLMEVKVNERIPNWMVALLGKHQCSLQKVSKYCAALAVGKSHLYRALAHKENLYG
jgi:SPX domain protein involved in polyphosphate accumulation